MDKALFAERLRVALARKGWRAARLAKELGVSRQLAASWTRARALPSGPSAANLASLLGVPTEWLFPKGAEASRGGRGGPGRPAKQRSPRKGSVLPSQRVREGEKAYEPEADASTVKPRAEAESLSAEPHDRVPGKPTREWTQDDWAKAAGAALARILGGALERGTLSVADAGLVLLDLAKATADHDLDPQDLVNMARHCLWWEKQRQTGSTALLPEPSLEPFTGTSSRAADGGSKS